MTLPAAFPSSVSSTLTPHQDTIITPINPEWALGCPTFPTASRISPPLSMIVHHQLKFSLTEAKPIIPSTILLLLAYSFIQGTHMSLPICKDPLPGAGSHWLHLLTNPGVSLTLQARMVRSSLTHPCLSLLLAHLIPRSSFPSAEMPLSLAPPLIPTNFPTNFHRYPTNSRPPRSFPPPTPGRPPCPPGWPHHYQTSPIYPTLIWLTCLFC